MDISSLPSNILIALATGRLEVARDLLAKLLRQEPQNASAWLALAATVPPDQAILALRRALVSDPDNAIALRNLLRLRGDKGATISLGDVWPTETSDEEAPTLFEHEQPTVPLRPPQNESDFDGPEQARFGDDCATMPLAFHSLLSLSETVKPKIAAYLPPQFSDLLSKPQTATGVALKEKEPHIQAEPTPFKVYAPGPAWPTAVQKPAATASLAARKTPLITSQLVERSPANFVSNSTNYLPYGSATPAIPTTKTMPKLYNGPRPQLGMMPEPMLGFTSFGLLVLVAAIALVILALVVLL